LASTLIADLCTVRWNWVELPSKMNCSLASFQVLKICNIIMKRNYILSRIMLNASLAQGHNKIGSLLNPMLVFHLDSPTFLQLTCEKTSISWFCFPASLILACLCVWFFWWWSVPSSSPSLPIQQQTHEKTFISLGHFPTSIIVLVGYCMQTADGDEPTQKLSRQ
jgi:hypothetical protein